MLLFLFLKQWNLTTAFHPEAQMMHILYNDCIMEYWLKDSEMRNREKIKQNARDGNLAKLNL